ncbi:Uncharacterised protein [Bordetella pertussis]|nr:Uncharacterised protein [Bordetella pertussis]
MPTDSSSAVSPPLASGPRPSTSHDSFSTSLTSG